MKPGPVDDARAVLERPVAGDLWVFGYGSLMWRPGFEHAEMQRARLHGYHRSLCVWSWVHRGTPHVPGLVLGLDRGGSCVGRAFRVPARARRSTLEYLREREMVTNVYLPTWQTARLEDGRVVETLTFRVRRDHHQYAGRMPAEAAARAVVCASGRGGHNIEYVANTISHLVECGVRDHHLESVHRKVLELASAGN